MPPPWPCHPLVRPAPAALSPQRSGSPRWEQAVTMPSLRGFCLNRDLVAEMFPPFIFVGSLPELCAHKDLAVEGNWAGCW